MVGAAPVSRVVLPAAEAEAETGCGSALASCCFGAAAGGLAATACGSDFDSGLGLAARTVVVCFGAAAGFDFGAAAAGAGGAAFGSSLEPNRLPKNPLIPLEPPAEATCTDEPGAGA